MSINTVKFNRPRNAHTHLLDVDPLSASRHQLAGCGNRVNCSAHTRGEPWTTMCLDRCPISSMPCFSTSIWRSSPQRSGSGFCMLCWLQQPVAVAMVGWGWWWQGYQTRRRCSRLQNLSRNQEQHHLTSEHTKVSDLFFGQFVVWDYLGCTQITLNVSIKITLKSELQLINGGQSLKLGHPVGPLGLENFWPQLYRGRSVNPRGLWITQYYEKVFFPKFDLFEIPCYLARESKNCHLKSTELWP